LANLKEESSRLKAQWQNEKAAINAISVLNGQLEEARQQQEAAQRAGDLNLAGQIQYGRIPDLQKKLAATEKELNERQGKRLLNQEVTEEDIARVVASWTGVPVSRMLEGERAKLVHMEDRLRERVVNQDEAVCRTLIGPPAPLFSWDLPAWARPSWPVPSLNSCSMMKMP
jgi:ATP-dependent Clp protease ATP-binding subunit ClpB